MASQGPEPRGYPLCASLLCENQDASKTQRWPLGSVAPFFVLKIWIFARSIWLGRFQNNAHDVRETVHL